MAKLEYRGKTYVDATEIGSVLADHGVPFERWQLRAEAPTAADDQVLKIYDADVERLKRERGYLSVDLVAMNPQTPNLDAIAAKFDKEHHHVDDEVRFTVAGEGVFAIEETGGREFLKFTAQPGDLIVIPAMRRHLFYLTAERQIRCIRLFQSQAGWEALYDRP